MRIRSTAALIQTNELAIMGAILVMSLGVLGMFLSIAIGIHPSMLDSWIFLACGCAYFFYAFATREEGEALWRALTSLLYIFAGLYLYLFFVPEFRLKDLIFVVGAVVLLEGVMEGFIFFRLRGRDGSGWIVAGAIATIFLALIIWCLWPFTSMRLIAGLVGAKFVLSGLSRLMYSLAMHKKLEARAQEQGLFAWPPHSGPSGLHPLNRER